MSGSGSSGARKCGSARKPPIADRIASTISTPVIDARGSGKEERRAAMAAGEGEPENLILGEESGERRDAGDGGSCNSEGRAGYGNSARQPAHFPDVLLAPEGVDHAAGTEEEAGLEKRMRVEMKDRHAVRPHTQRHEHEAELRDRRIRQHLLDVRLHDGDRGGEKGSKRT